MQTIGERLEEARKRKGISIREAAETTKIRGDYLQKFEANTFEIDLPALYIRGFLTSYARYLDLDPARIVSDFNSLVANQGKPSRRENREVYGRVDLDEKTPDAEDDGSSSPTGRPAMDQAVLLKFGLLIGGAVVAITIIVLLINVLFSRSSAKSSTEAGQAMRQAARSNQSNEATFTVTAIESTRVKVAYFDKSDVFLDGKYPLNRGESKTIRYSKDLLVTVENPAGIRIELNGRAVDVPTNKAMGQFRVPVELPR